MNDSMDEDGPRWWLPTQAAWTVDTSTLDPVVDLYNDASYEEHALERDLPLFCDNP